MITSRTWTVLISPGIQSLELSKHVPHIYYIIIVCLISIYMYVSCWYKHTPAWVCVCNCFVATVCTAFSVPFSDYFVSKDIWHISEFSMLSTLFIAALSLLFL